MLHKHCYVLKVSATYDKIVSAHIDMICLFIKLSLHMHVHIFNKCITPIWESDTILHACHIISKEQMHRSIKNKQTYINSGNDILRLKCTTNIAERLNY